MWGRYAIMHTVSSDCEDDDDDENDDDENDDDMILIYMNWWHKHIIGCDEVGKSLKTVFFIVFDLTPWGAGPVMRQKW